MKKLNIISLLLLTGVLSTELTYPIFGTRRRAARREDYRVYNESTDNQRSGYKDGYEDGLADGLNQANPSSDADSVYNAPRYAVNVDDEADDAVIQSMPSNGQNKMAELRASMTQGGQDGSHGKMAGRRHHMSQNGQGNGQKEGRRRYMGQNGQGNGHGKMAGHRYNKNNTQGNNNNSSDSSNNGQTASAQ